MGVPPRDNSHEKWCWSSSFQVSYADILWAGHAILLLFCKEHIDRQSSMQDCESADKDCVTSPKNVWVGGYIVPLQVKICSLWCWNPDCMLIDNSNFRAKNDSFNCRIIETQLWPWCSQNFLSEFLNDHTHHFLYYVNWSKLKYTRSKNNVSVMFQSVQI